MKYLRLVNHLGVQVAIFEVFVEGQDFEYEFAVPTAIWLGRIQIVDKVPKLEPELEHEEKVKEAAREMVEALGLSEPEPEPELIPIIPSVSEEEVEGEGELRGEVKERLLTIQQEEVEHAPETVCDEGIGDSRTGTSEQPESAAELPQLDTGRKAGKRGKKPGHRKAT